MTALTPSPLPSTREIVRLGMIATAFLHIQSPLLASDGFVFGKTLLLVLSAAVVLSVFLVESPRILCDKIDAILLALLALLAISCAGALNGWNSAGGSVVAAASIVLFWTCRSISLTRCRIAFLLTTAVALGIVVASSLIEAYTPIAFSTRPPGGTIGNRNRMAHLVVIVAPSLALLTTRIRVRWLRGLILMGVALAGGALLLSRARGAWLAALVVMAGAVTLALVRRRRIGKSDLWTRRSHRLTLFGSATVVGIAFAFLLPNQLAWVSVNPYRDSLAGLLDHQSGTGAGRLIEYRTTLRMIGDHPILGVGPGNWRIAYPNYASPGDPNIEPGYLPVRRFPQGEWIGTAAERGLPSLVLLVLFGGILTWHWLRAIASERSHRKVGYAYAGLLTMLGVFMVGLFDPVIMTPTAGFIVPVILGVCAAPFARIRAWTPTPWVRRALIGGVIVGGAFLVSFPARDLWAAMTYARRPTLENFRRAAEIAPGDFRAHFFAASMLVQLGDCTRAAPYIESARQLYPTAPAAIELEERCAEIVAIWTSSESDRAAAAGLAEFVPPTSEIPGR